VYRKIMVPVDLVHRDQLDKALKTAADLAKHYGASVTYVGVTPETPSPVAHNPKEYGQKLAAFAKEQGEANGHGVDSLAMTSTDPAIDLDKVLLSAVEKTGADLVVMASHKPNVADWFWASHGGTVASDADISVMLVR
jgi:nucleotide-binding universal stress UspA family protein